MTKSTRDSSCDQVAKTLLQEHTGSETTLNTVKGWLSKCDEGHSKSHACVVKMRALNYPTVPTRLIDVHGHGSKTWSLIETKKNQSFSKYVALSHRWTDDTPRLLRDNCISFQTGQHDKDVPRNYQDVFVLCRKLDIRYVWIDSLCIVQDSADDFLREASTMTEVYANAFCTFSICWESPDGFLRPRDTRTIPRDGPFSSTWKCFLDQSASLDISCLLIQAKYLELEGPKDVKKSLEKSVDQTTDGCFNWYTDGFLLPLPYPRLHSDERSVITVPIEPCDNFIATCFVMPLLGGIYHHDVSIRGLVVQERPQADRKTREFVRIGSFTRYHDIEDPIKDREIMAVMA
ncbi:unnamed protein product [Fusarium graminearum]|nr:unnamed protein product [Fusarium graminearum]